MKVLNLHCAHGHGFEGWFASSADFESQLADGLVACPSCGDTRVQRLPSAPYVLTRSAPAPKPPADSDTSHAAPPLPSQVVAQVVGAGYMLGQEIWVKARETARARLGDAFDIRAFHDAGLLYGAMPLSVLSAHLDGWARNGGRVA